MARPPRIEKLRHDRILCGRVFRFFVETWNWLTAYVDNLKGDADLNPMDGSITVDRTNPDAPVIRLTRQFGNDGKAAQAVAPWTFVCTIEEPEEEGEEETRTGGWKNCILQLGYNYFLASPDVQAARSGITSLSGAISGTNLTDDGSYVCEVNIAQKTAAIMLKANATHTYPIDFENNIVYVDIGTVTSGVQVSGIPNHPVIYTYQ